MSIRKSVRFKVFERDSFTCRYCGRNSEVITLEVDHIHPKSKGGTDHIENLATSCSDCNRGKAGRVLKSAPMVDYLAMAQEMREQELVAKEIAKRERKERKLKDRFRDKLCDLVGLCPVEDGFHRQTLRILFSFTKEFSEEVVLIWVQKAIDVVGPYDQVKIGRYVSGIRRRMKESVAHE
jgi:CRISPR/Cas system Type II protein with McrA/HNH and RuvC-like nuclease domain